MVFTLTSHPVSVGCYLCFYELRISKLPLWGLSIPHGLLFSHPSSVCCLTRFRFEKPGRQALQMWWDEVDAVIQLIAFMLAPVHATHATVTLQIFKKKKHNFSDVICGMIMGPCMHLFSFSFQGCVAMLSV